MSRRACRECGCTEARACVGGCSWVEPDLCSTCAGAGLKAGIAAALTEAWIDRAYAMPESERRLAAAGMLPEPVVDVLEGGPQDLAAAALVIVESCREEFPEIAAAAPAATPTVTLITLGGRP